MKAIRRWQREEVRGTLDSGHETKLRFDPVPEILILAECLGPQSREMRTALQELVDHGLVERKPASEFNVVGTDDGSQLSWFQGFRFLRGDGALMELTWSRSPFSQDDISQKLVSVTFHDRQEQPGSYEFRLDSPFEDSPHLRLSAKGVPLLEPAGAKQKPPLTDTEKNVLDVIREQPEGSAITGKEIIQKLGGNISQPTLTSHIIPMLKKHYGVDNRPGAGYYIKPS